MHVTVLAANEADVDLHLTNKMWSNIQIFLASRGAKNLQRMHASRSSYFLTPTFGQGWLMVALFYPLNWPGLRKMYQITPSFLSNMNSALTIELNKIKS